jgi:hypothetical protein
LVRAIWKWWRDRGAFLAGSCATARLNRATQAPGRNSSEQYHNTDSMAIYVDYCYNTSSAEER